MSSPTPRALLVDSRSSGELSRLVAAEGFTAIIEAGVESALVRLETVPIDLTIVHLGTPGITGFVTEHAERFPEVPVVAVESEQGVAVDGAVHRAAAEWISGPVDPEDLGAALQRALARSRSAVDVPPPPGVPRAKLLGASREIERVRDLVHRIAPSDATVLVRGETGTGKELVARQLHELSKRRNGPFVKTHLAALPDALVESELFGYEKGAFTGAAARKPGRIEVAEGGTLFLDEIGEVSPSVQAKLLRLIQEREYERLGATRSLRADVRFVAATHRDLEHMVEEGTFREDLFYRLNVVSIWLPPLRARREDIPELARAHAAALAAAGALPPVALDDSALSLLRSQRWPGNVRQLLNLVERCVVLARGKVVTADDVRRELDEQVSFVTQSAATSGPDPSIGTPRGANTQDTNAPGGPPSTVRPLRDEVRSAERRALEKALASTKGNRSQAARLLGVSRRTLYTKLEEHGIDR